MCFSFSQVGRGEVVDGRDAAEHLLDVELGALRDEAVEALPHPGEAALDGAGVGVVEEDGAPGGGGDLGDAGAHLAGADDEDGGDWRGGAGIVRHTGSVGDVALPPTSPNGWCLAPPGTGRR